MELSDEQKRRILEEEQQRLAQEQYREQVRRELRTYQPPVSPPAEPKPRKSNPIRAGLLLVAGVLALCAALLMIGRLAHQGKPSESASIAPAASPDRGQSFAEMERSLRESALRPTPMPTLTTAQIAERATPSVVVVENFNEDGEKAGQGSGYVSSADGIVITNYHVIRGASSLGVRVPSRESFRVESVLGYDIQNDVAALQVSGASVPALQTEEVELVKVGDRVVAIGAPLGLESTVSEGIISALRDMGGTHMIQTTTAISPGSSGGPLLNEYGKVIGLTTSQAPDGQNLNFVICARHITELLNRRRQISLSEVLSETQVVDQLPGSTISIPARNGVRLNFTVNGQQGAVLEGTYTISGGAGSDVEVALVTSDDRVIFNSGRVKGFGRMRQRLLAGRYSLIFNNSFSTFSSKSVSPDLKLVYYR
jgi:hypothetical protein